MGKENRLLHSDCCNTFHTKCRQKYVHDIDVAVASRIPICSVFTIADVATTSVLRDNLSAIIDFPFRYGFLSSLNVNCHLKSRLL